MVIFPSGVHEQGRLIHFIQLQEKEIEKKYHCIKILMKIFRNIQKNGCS